MWAFFLQRRLIVVLRHIAIADPVLIAAEFNQTRTPEVSAGNGQFVHVRTPCELIPALTVV